MLRRSLYVSLSGAALLALGLTHCDDSTDENPVVTPCHLEPRTPSTAPAQTASQLSPINHIVVLFLENHSYDALYGALDADAGAEGLQNLQFVPQQDTNGDTYINLPQPMNTDVTPNIPDDRFPIDLQNSPFEIDQYTPNTVATHDLVHRWYQEQQQINGGKNNRFAAVSDAKGLSLGHYRTSDLPMTKEALSYTLCDHFFHSAFGGSFLNHQWLIAAASPVFPEAPDSMLATEDAKGNMVKDGNVIPKGCYVVNTSFSQDQPHPSTASADQLVPPQTHATIGDRLSDANVDWAWYSGGWNDAAAGKPDPKFQFHHQPFVYFKNYFEGAPGRAHLKDESDFFAAAKSGQLPPVSFVKPIGELNEHPGYAVLVDGENHVLDMVNAVRNGPNWHDTAIIVTYDEHGGFWDHVAPPTIDKWGPGLRVPTIIISPFAKRGFIDKTVYDTTSILATIEHRWGLPPLTSRDEKATDLSNAFSFGTVQR
jgi:phospholipase C